MLPNRFIIVNPMCFGDGNFPVNNSTSNLGVGSNSIHVNPNFSQVHINPKFVRKPTTATTAKSKTNPLVFVNQSNALKPSSSMAPYADPTNSSIYSWRRKVATTPLPSKALQYHPLLGGTGTLPLSRPTPINAYSRNSPSKSSDNACCIAGVPSKHKFIAKELKHAVINKKHENLQCCSKSLETSHNGMKLIRKAATITFETTSKSMKKRKSNSSKMKFVAQSREKFKIDKRPEIIRRRSFLKWKKVVTRSRYKIENLFPKGISRRNKYELSPKLKTSQQPFVESRVQKVIKKTRFINKKVVNIGGIMYRVSSHKLTRASGDKVPLLNGPVKSDAIKGLKKFKKHVIQVRGERFILSRNGATMKRLPGQVSLAHPQTRVDFGGVTFRQASDNTFVRTQSHRARVLLRQARLRSIATLASLRQKINSPCMIYHKLGQCRKKDRGMCPYTHDKKNISLCKRFLQDACTGQKCMLSHSLVHQKVATCHYFLEGCCTRENCPFLHVKLSNKANICAAFLQGYCEQGQQCSKRHINICPDYEKTGKCKQGMKCPYPHKKLHSGKPHKRKKISVLTKNVQGECKKQRPNKSLDSKDPPAGRYYDSIESADGPSTDIVPDRSKLQKLPAFIALDKS